MTFSKNNVLRLSFLFVLAVVFASGINAESKKPQVDRVRVIIQLDGAPLAQYHDTLSIKGVDAARQQNGHIDVKAPASQTYINYLKQQQTAFGSALQASFSNVQLQQHYQIGFNGMAAMVSRKDMDAIRKMPGVVAVTETYKLEPELDASRTLINLNTLWAALPSGSPAGTGRRFALIDSGVNANHPFFNPTGFVAPSGYPKSFRYDSGVYTAMDTAHYTSGKVIVANVYVQPGDSSAGFGFPYGNGSDHGDHVAGIASGVAGTYTFTTGAVPFSLGLSGMAPGAYIMSYRVTGDTAEFMAAVEDVIADQADAVNLSLGHSRWVTTDFEHDPIRQALDAAFDAGVVVCGSAGNAGANGASSITGAWKYSKKVIAVANSTTARLFSNPVSTGIITGPQGRVGVPGGAPAPGFGSPMTAQVVLAPGGVGGDAGTGCVGTIPPGTATGKICVIQRGVCVGGFAEKQAACVAGGGIGFIVYNQLANAGAVPLTMGGLIATIPGVEMTRADGLALVSHLTLNPTDTITIGTIGYLTSGWPDIVDTSSSQGPTPDGSIKPDVAAPGTNILSSVVDTTTGEVIPGGEFNLFSGTSMSTPHVTGNAVLTRALHPNWTPAQVKSAIMNTANPNMFVDIANTPARARQKGAGRLDSGKLVDPWLTFDPPSVSFGNRNSGFSGGVNVTATDMRSSGGSQTWTVSFVGLVTNANVVLSLPSSTFSTLPGQTASFTANVATTGAPAGDFEGSINVTNGAGQTFNLPYYIRVLNPAAHKQIGLLDWDINNLDYQPGYTGSLVTLGYTFDVLNGGTSTAANGNAGIPLSTLQNYDAIVLYMGDNFARYSQAHTGGSFALEDYLEGGGRLILIGQDVNSNVAYDQNVGTDFTFTSMAGWIDTDFDFYPVATGLEELNTQFTLFGQSGDASTNLGGDGAQNLFFPDAGRVVRAEDRDDPNISLYNAENIAPHARALGNYTVTEMDGVPVELTSNVVATGVAPDLTLENSVARVNWRAALMHIGVESLNADTGADLNTTTALAGLLSFVFDDITATLSASGSGANRDFTCIANSPIASDIASYRWDFGDGSPWTTTSINTTSHTYPGNGSFTARCEPITEFTRSAVANKGLVVFCNPIGVSPATIPDGTIGVAYSATILASGGVAPITFSVSSGSLPGGLTLNAGTGEISGAPTATGSFTFTISASGADGCAGSQEYTVTISCATISLAPPTLPTGTTGSAYTATITASGGAAPYTFTSDPLPAGLSMSASGSITGTPTAAGTTNFDVTATDVAGCQGSASYSITIACATITVDASALPDATEGAAYSHTITASGGTAPYAWSVTGGTLPNGVTLNSSTGELSGTPTESGTFNFTVQAQDANGCSGTAALSLTVNNSVCPTITLTPATLPDGTIGTAYSQTVTASGGAAPYSYAVTTGTLPAGLSLNASTGEVSGTPTAAGTSNFTITATDDNACTGAQSYSITVAASCLYCDEFNDQTVTWTTVKGTWTESAGGSLTTTAGGKKNEINSGALFAGCLNCSIEVSMQTAGGSGKNTLYLLGWYVDKKNNIELSLSEHKDKVYLKQRTNGHIAKKTNATATIDANTAIIVNISFDGTNFDVTINGTPVITDFVPKNAVPSGKVGFQVKATTGSFDYIHVN